MRNFIEIEYRKSFPYYFLSGTSTVMFYGTTNEYSEDDIHFKKNIADIYVVYIKMIYEK